MATRNARANTGYFRRRRINCAHHEHISHTTLIRWLIVGSALLLTLLLAMPAYSQAGPCEMNGSTNEIGAKLAGALESAPYFTQVLGVNDNYKSLSLGVDVPGNRSWAMSFIYDRQISDRWSTDSFFCQSHV
jgi:hypothetical protein